MYNKKLKDKLREEQAKYMMCTKVYLVVGSIPT